MNKLAIIILSIAVFGCASTGKVASSTKDLTFNYSMVGIKKGYDHPSKLVIYDNGTKIGEAIPKKESEMNSVTVSLSSGSHKIRAVLMANYENKWEEHLKDNDYSLDAVYEETLQINGNKTITLVFDIDQEKTIVK